MKVFNQKLGEILEDISSKLPIKLLKNSIKKNFQ